MADASSSSTAPETLAAHASASLRTLRAQMVTGDITDRVSALVTLATTLLDRELMHPARIARDKAEADAAEKAEKEAQAKAEKEAQAANQAAAAAAKDATTPKSQRASA